MINLSKRLALISSLIDKEDIVFDVGCDHALLDIYLSNKYNKKYYASDIKECVIDKAKENVKKYNANKVVLLCGNGLEKINDEVNTVVISGMGYITMSFILRNINKYKNVNKVILQSNTNHEEIRKFMLKKGFYIYEEHIVFDKFYYIVTVFKKGRKHYNKMDKELGIINDKDFDKYLKIELKKNKVLLTVVPKKYLIKRFKIKNRIKLISKKLETIK